MGNTTLDEKIHGCMTSNLNSRPRIEWQEIIHSDSFCLKTVLAERTEQTDSLYKRGSLKKYNPICGNVFLVKGQNTRLSSKANNMP